MTDFSRQSVTRIQGFFKYTLYSMKHGFNKNSRLIFQNKGFPQWRLHDFGSGDFKGVGLVGVPGGASRTQDNFRQFEKKCLLKIAKNVLFYHIFQNSLKTCVHVSLVWTKNTNVWHFRENLKKIWQIFENFGQIFQKISWEHFKNV